MNSEFYSRKSGYASPLRIDTAAGIASLLKAKWGLGLEGSVLIANPVPSEQEIDAREMEVHIHQALAAANENKVSGKEVTPSYFNTSLHTPRAKALMRILH